MNPVDAKIREGNGPILPGGEAKVFAGMRPVSSRRPPPPKLRVSSEAIRSITPGHWTAPDPTPNSIWSMSASLATNHLGSASRKPPLYQTADMGEEDRVLNEVAALVDGGLIRTTMNTNFGLINAGNIRRAHTIAESRTAIGKLVLSGF